MSVPPAQWTHSVRDTAYLVSTDKSLLDLDFIKASFQSEAMYWTKAVSDRSMALLIENSECFGLYEESTSGRKQVGFARIVTDYATLAYLTDVIVSEEHRGGGLGKWLIKCVDERVEKMEDLRRFILLTGKGSKAIPFYQGFGLSETTLDRDGLVLMVKTGPGATLSLSHT